MSGIILPSGADNPFYELRYWVGQRVSPGFLFVKVLWENLNEFITWETNEAPSGNRPDPSQDQWEKRASFTKGKNQFWLTYVFGMCFQEAREAVSSGAEVRQRFRESEMERTGKRERERLQSTLPICVVPSNRFKQLGVENIPQNFQKALKSKTWICHPPATIYITFTLY